MTVDINSFAQKNTTEKHLGILLSLYDLENRKLNKKSSVTNCLLLL